jgi:proline racemase
MASAFFVLPMIRIKTIDAEVAGEAVRLIVSGGPTVPGRTMTEKLNWLRRKGGELRSLLMLEPRGHAGMHGAMLTEPTSATAHAGVLSMHAAGFPLVSGESIIGAVTIALENKLIEGVADEVLVDTPAGLFRARPRLGATGLPIEAQSVKADTRVTSVAVTGVPSFVHTAGLPLRIGTRRIAVDIAFGGQFYAIADSEAIGVSIDMANAAALVRMGREIKDAIESTLQVQHPIDASLKDIHGTILTGASRAAADLRSATVLDGEVLRRSPGVTGTAALLAVLDAMGLLTEGHRFAHEGVLGTTLHGSVVRRTDGDPSTTIPVIEGSASITGFHEFVSG